MKSYFFTLLSLIVASAYATRYSHSSTFYGCPTECHTEKEPKCEHGLPSDRHFVALHNKYFESKTDFCDNYWVGMILDEKANGDYKMLRGKVVDQCGSCAETQVDLSSDMFGKIASHSTGVVQMMYVLINKDTNEIMDGPVYSSDSLSKFSKRHGISSNAVLESFKEGAKYLNKHHINGMHDFPWRSGAFHGSEEKKTTTVKKTTTKKTTTTTVHHTHKTVPKVTTVEKTTTVAKATTTKKVNIPVVTPKVPAVEKPLSQAPANKTVDVPVVAQAEIPAETPVETPVVAPVVQKPVAEKPATQKPDAQKPVAQKPLDEKEEGSSPVAASVIGFGVVGAAGVGLVMLKRQSPQKYDDLKQKFPEAFGNIKRSVSRGASTIKRGVSRSVSRRGRTQVNTPPLPASYSFTLSNEDGLPRVALYDDPYPTKTHGAQHW